MGQLLYCNCIARERAGWDDVTIQLLYCDMSNLAVEETLLQSVYCIVIESWADGHCIAIHSGVL